MAQVFFSYRHDDCLKHERGERHFAYDVLEHLNRRFSPDLSFMDTQLEAGKWPEQLQRRLSESVVVLLFLSPHSLDPKPGDETEDWFRREISAALELGKTIVPVRYVDRYDEAGGRPGAAFVPPADDGLYRELDAACGFGEISKFQGVDYYPFGSGQSTANTLDSIAEKVRPPLVRQAFSDLRNRSRRTLDTIAEEKFGNLPVEDLIAPVTSEERAEPYRDLFDALRNETGLRPGRPVLLTAPGGQGKSTQMIRFGQKLTDWEEGRARYACFYVRLHHLSGGRDILDTLFKAAGLSPAVCGFVRDDMNSPPDQGAGEVRRYYLLLDGLDEVRADSPVIRQIRYLDSPENGGRYVNLQLIAAGRNGTSGIFGRDTLNLRLKDLTWSQVSGWLRKNGHETPGAFAGILGSPMLLLLACRMAGPDVRRLKGHWLKNTARDTVSGGEVLWNYMQYLVERLDEEDLPAEKKAAAADLVRRVLPAAAYYCAFRKTDRKMECSTAVMSRIMGAEQQESMWELLRGNFMGLMRKEDRNTWSFSHRLFRDWFAMAHAANAYRKLLAGGTPSEADYEIMSNRSVLENTENSSLLVCILPGVMRLNGSYEAGMAEACREIAGMAGGADGEFIRMLGAAYPDWAVKAWLPYVRRLKKEGRPVPDVFRGFIRAAFDGMEALAARWEAAGCRYLLPWPSVSFVYCVLSQCWRDGSLVTTDKPNTVIPGLEPDLNRSMFYARRALEIYEKDSELSDALNYVGKAFNSAKEWLANRAETSPGGFALRPSDLLLTDGLLAPAAGRIPAPVRMELAAAGPGSTLSPDMAARRIDALRTLAEYWLNESARRSCVLSMNMLALIDEMEQEEKPAGERAFLKAYGYYRGAAELKQPSSPYSAMKAALLLAQGKVGIAGDGTACLPGSADPEKTAAEASLLHETAAARPEYWGQAALCRGLLKLRYGLDIGTLQPLGRKTALSEAYDDISVAFSEWKPVLVCVEFLEAGLALAKENPALRGKIGEELRAKPLRRLFDPDPKTNRSEWARFAGSSKAGRSADSWTPSRLVVLEYAERVKAAIEACRDILPEPGLGEYAEKGPAAVDEQVRLLCGAGADHT